MNITTRRVVILSDPKHHDIKYLKIIENRCGRDATLLSQRVRVAEIDRVFMRLCRKFRINYKDQSRVIREVGNFDEER